MNGRIRRSTRLGRPKLDDSVGELVISGIASGRRSRAQSATARPSEMGVREHDGRLMTKYGCTMGDALLPRAADPASGPLQRVRTSILLSRSMR